jgi:hypothetical protein
MIDDLGRIRAVVDDIDLHFCALFPNDVLLVDSNFARVIKSVLHLHVLLRLAGAACNVRGNMQLARCTTRSTPTFC